MKISIIMTLLVLLFWGILLGLFCFAVRWLVYRTREGQLRQKDVPSPPHAASPCRSLGEALKAQRIRCAMTQEFVAEALGVSRQAVSKWENGTSDPSTANLLSLAKLYGISAAELLEHVQN